ncbi:hypothetical protein AB1L30_02265, partial [Bremerella sp. JC817]|uniref:hypothetical protein n=1 Tax=Bremerella sp. JC817 TaxID=3231756 RepID=UPI003458E543
TPVPFPNTAVKHNQPMIVPTSAKVGIAGFIYTSKPRSYERGFFVALMGVQTDSFRSNRLRRGQSSSGDLRSLLNLRNISPPGVSSGSSGQYNRQKSIPILNGECR